MTMTTERPATNAVYRNTKSGKLYRVSSVFEVTTAKWLNPTAAPEMTVLYTGLRDGKKFGPYRSTTLDKFLAGFTLVSND